MGSASSKPTTKGSRRKKSCPELDQNQQNNHIIQDVGDRFSLSGESRKARNRAGSTASINKLNSYGDRTDRDSSTEDVCISNNNNKQLVLRPVSASTCGRIRKTDFKVVKLKVGIDKKPTSLDEKSTAVLKYRTPHFRAYATVEVPELCAKQAIRLGWIQTCSSMRFVNTYGQEGVTSWEFPEIVTRKFTMVSDADGKQYPWYGSKHEIQTVTGPSQKQTVALHMNDNFFPQVTWYIPHSSFDRSPRLTHVHRKQNFFTFLVMKDLCTDTYHVLKAISWSMTVNIEIKPEFPLGRRAKLQEPFEQKPPIVLGEDSTIRPEPYAMKPPNANNSQVLMWRPLKGDPKIVVPPDETTLNLEKYLQMTREHIYHLVTHVRET